MGFELNVSCVFMLNYVVKVECRELWPTRREPVYLRVLLFGQVGRTCTVRPVFPLVFNQCFHFQKVSKYCTIIPCSL